LAEQRIVCGDFNAWPGSTENATMTAAYFDSWAQAQAKGTAIAYPGNTAGNTRNSRIDYIYYSRAASALVLKSSQVFDTRDANGIMPSDHRPLLSVFDVK
jgi:endonuclease/exonuclease/phosphatase family metal-dependent hydrolase